MRLRRSFIAAAALLATCAGSVAAGPWSLAPGEYYAELSGSLLSSNSDYDVIGQRVMRNGLFEARALTPYLELGWKKRVSIQMSLPVLSDAVRDNVTRAAGSNAGLGDFGLGLRYSLRNGPGAAAIEVDWTAPAGYNRDLQPALGSGRQSLGARLQVGHALGRIGFVQAGAGYRTDYRAFGSRGTDPSLGGAALDWADHMIYDGAVGVTRGRVLLAALYDGEVDQTSGLPDAGSTQQRFGSRITYRVDARLDTFAGSWHVPFGKNAAHFDEYFAGLAWKMTKLGPLQGFLGGRP